jgi:hypothetical protein
MTPELRRIEYRSTRGKHLWSEISPTSARIVGEKITHYGQRFSVVACWQTGATQYATVAEPVSAGGGMAVARALLSRPNVGPNFA